MLITLSGRRFIKIQHSSFPLFPVAYPFRIATQLQYYVKREKCKINDVIFPSGCEARTINLDNKNMKIDIFTGGTSVKTKNIFTPFNDILPVSMKKKKDIFLHKLWKAIITIIIFYQWDPFCLTTE